MCRKREVTQENLMKYKKGKRQNTLLIISLHPLRYRDETHIYSSRTYEKSDSGYINVFMHLQSLKLQEGCWSTLLLTFGITDFTAF